MTRFDSSRPDFHSKNTRKINTFRKNKAKGFKKEVQKKLKLKVI
jgi:hypothetical protein